MSTGKAYHLAKWYRPNDKEETMERTYLLKDRNGMLVRVPESKLGEGSKQQEGEAKAPAEDAKERIRQKIYQELGLK